MAEKTVSINKIRELLAGSGNEPLSDMAIYQFVKDGMPKAARGQYDATACMTWYIARLRAAADRRKVEGKDGQEVSLDQADIRLKTVKAQLEEMTLAEREGRLVPLEIFESELSKFASTVQASLLNLPSRLASKMEGLTTLERKALLTAAVRGCLTTLSEKANDGREPEPHTGNQSRAAGKPAGKRRKGS